MTSHRIVILLLIAAAAATARGQVPASDEPTADETLLLELMNRCRGDPAGEAERLYEMIKDEKIAASGVDAEMFRKEMKEFSPAPPLVFDLRLIRTARNHANYLSLNRTRGHIESAGAKGFTGEKPSDRMWKALGEKLPCSENVFWMVAVLQSHPGLVIDWGPGPGGMQDGRGHRVNIMNPKKNLVGIGVVPAEPPLFTVVHNFVESKSRFAGGVMYVDANGNGAYDAGEGRGGVTVAGGGGRTTTWASGAYALRIGPGNVTLTAHLDGIDASKTVNAPGGSTNVKFDWAISPDDDRRWIDSLLTAAESIADKGSSQYIKAVLALDRAKAGLAADSPVLERVDQVTTPIRKQLDDARERVRAALAGDAAKGAAAVAREKKPFVGTEAASWFDDAAAFAVAMREVAAFEQRAPKIPDATKRARAAEPIAKRLERVRDNITSSEFRIQIDELIQRAQSAAAGAPNK